MIVRDRNQNLWQTTKNPNPEEWINECNLIIWKMEILAHTVSTGRYRLDSSSVVHLNHSQKYQKSFRNQKQSFLNDNITKTGLNTVAGAGAFIKLVITCLLVQVNISGWCENSIIRRKNWTENKYVFYRKKKLCRICLFSFYYNLRKQIIGFIN